jgi:hypothetical protein
MGCAQSSIKNPQSTTNPTIKDPSITNALKSIADERKQAVFRQSSRPLAAVKCQRRGYEEGDAGCDITVPPAL